MAPRKIDGALETMMNMQVSELTEDNLNSDDAENAAEAEYRLDELRRVFTAHPDLYKILTDAMNLCKTIQNRAVDLGLLLGVQIRSSLAYTVIHQRTSTVHCQERTHERFVLPEVPGCHGSQPSRGSHGEVEPQGLPRLPGVLRSLLRWSRRDLGVAPDKRGRGLQASVS